MAQQIKSKKRVTEHGEVFTAEREVNAMLDLVKQETERIDSRFLEPACGNGNFLVEILRRKLMVIWSINTKQYGRKADHNKINCELVQAVCSIYGIDIMQDNVEECRLRLLEIISEWYPHAHLGGRLDGDLLETVRFVLKRNVLWGDALTLCTPDERKEPIIFSEWGFIGQSVKRRDFTLDMLLRPRKFEGPSLFDSLGDDVFIPEPCAEYPMLNYDKLYTQDY
ncbi:MAG: SAM-dependent DNA methyltransferase [Bacteroidaceae bacterium]|nr:SAM-dependent DNA methyltransferase [Bacteroidaceae bacterium]